jgi:hemolysin III
MIDGVGGIDTVMEQSAERPLLRGWSHALFAVPAAAGALALVLLAHGDPLKQLAFAVYGVALTALFAVSALYHRGAWSPRVRSVWRRIDHFDIHLLIAATYTPIAVVLLSGVPRALLLAVVWTAALSGGIVALTGVRVPRSLLTIVYVAVGWMAVAVLPALYPRIGAGGIATISAGGILYSLGAVIYATQRPSLWPRVFGYHEVFHLLVIAGTAIFFCFMAATVVPAARM